MRGASAALSCAVLTVLLAGCMHGTFHPTPCEPAGEPVHGTIRVQLPKVVGEEEGQTTPTEGRCVALKQGDDRALATARITEGNATLPLPVEGDVYISWIQPWPRDKACANQGYAFVTVPGPANVTLQTGGICY